MFFHMLRTTLGERTFWGGLKDLYRKKLFQRVSWNQFQETFELYGGRSLQGFFEQWVEREGAPKLWLENVSAKREDEGWRIRGHILQEKPFYDLDIPILLETKTDILRQDLHLSKRVTPFGFFCDTPPIQLAVDPDYDILRRLAPSEIPPAINALKGSSSTVAVLCEGYDNGHKKAFETLLLSLGLKNVRTCYEKELTAKMWRNNDVLFYGLPKKGSLLPDMPAKVVTGKAGFTLNRVPYDLKSDVFFGVFAHPVAEGRVVALFLPLTEEYAVTVARKVTHYGKYSYLAFREGQNKDKGTWPITISPLMYVWEQ
jgi:hypothetical protein